MIAFSGAGVESTLAFSPSFSSHLLPRPSFASFSSPLPPPSSFRRHLVTSTKRLRPRQHTPFAIASDLSISDASPPPTVPLPPPAGPDGAPPPSPEAPAEDDGIFETLETAVNTAFDSTLWPLLSSISLVRDPWERRNGSFILRPPSRPKAVLHFLGGAFVGASPHVAYASLLSRLAKRGFLIVATPFDLSLDYLATTAAIAEKWEAVETGLALDYGPLPIVGVGHSAGCIFHALTCCLFDDASQKAGLVLISFNNKPIRDAIPAFEKIVTPLAKSAVNGEGALPDVLREALESLPGTIDAAVEGSVLTPKRLKDDVLPLVKDARMVVEQLGPLLREIAGKPRDNSEDEADKLPLTEFYPPPADTLSAVRTMYSVEQTLVVKFRSDSIDESEVILESVMNRGGPVDVSLIELGGSHITPLVQDPPSLTAAQDDGGFDLGVFGMLLTGLSDAVAASQTKELYTLEALIAEWVEAGLENGTL